MNSKLFLLMHTDINLEKEIRLTGALLMLLITLTCFSSDKLIIGTW